MTENVEIKEPKNKHGHTGVFSSRQIQYALVTALLIICLIGIAAVFVVRVYLLTETSCYDDLAVETQDSIDVLESNLRNDRMMLRVIAGFIGNSSDIDSIEVGGYLTNYDYNSLITQICVLKPDSSIRTSRGRQNYAKWALDFDEELALGEHICSVKSQSTNTKMIMNYVPIRREGLGVGMLFSTSSASNMAKAWLPSVYDNNGKCYVVDRKTGEILINSAGDGLENINDIPFTQTDPDYSRDSTVEAILNGKKGYSVFMSDSTNEDMYMCFLPFSIEDWEMVVFVPESAVFSAVKPVRNGLYKLGAIAAALIILYAVWLVRQIRSAIAETLHKANLDALTGLPNRNRYEAYLRELENIRGDIICLYIDANGLHELNNSKGHYAGDQMLRFIADTLKVEFGGEHIYRFGGDEFIAFLSDKTEEEVNEALEEFGSALQRNDYHAAVGLCVRTKDMTPEQLVKAAETKMYEAKKQYYDQTGKERR